MKTTRNANFDYCSIALTICCVAYTCSPSLAIAQVNEIGPRALVTGTASIDPEINLINNGGGLSWEIEAFGNTLQIGPANDTREQFKITGGSNANNLVLDGSGTVVVNRFSTAIQNELQIYPNPDEDNGESVAIGLSGQDNTARIQVNDVDDSFAISSGNPSALFPTLPPVFLVRAVGLSVTRALLHLVGLKASSVEAWTHQTIQFRSPKMVTLVSAGYLMRALVPPYTSTVIPYSCQTGIASMIGDSATIRHFLDFSLSTLTNVLALTKLHSGLHKVPLLPALESPNPAM